MNNKHFYIGWQDEMPAPTKSFLKRIIIALFLLLPMLVALAVLFQKPFNNHTFELGTIKEITGVYYDTPVPILLADEGVLPESFSRSILLVGFGASKLVRNKSWRISRKRKAILLMLLMIPAKKLPSLVP